MFRKKEPRREHDTPPVIVQHITVHVETPTGQSAQAVADATRKAIAEMARGLNNYRAWGDARPPHLH